MKKIRKFVLTKLFRGMIIVSIISGIVLVNNGIIINKHNIINWMSGDGIYFLFFISMLVFAASIWIQKVKERKIKVKQMVLE